jgi:hypothetical protein
LSCINPNNPLFPLKSYLTIDDTDRLFHRCGKKYYTLVQIFAKEGKLCTAQTFICNIVDKAWIVVEKLVVFVGYHCEFDRKLCPKEHINPKNANAVESTVFLSAWPPKPDETS